jgi:hypothetical protein
MAYQAGMVGLNVSRATRDKLHSLAYRLTGETGQRVTLDAALSAALDAAAADVAATVAALAKPDLED